MLIPCSFTRGYYQLVFKGSFNKKPIPGPSVNLIVIPDPTKPVSLSVEYDTSAKCLAGGTFPGLHLYLYFESLQVSTLSITLRSVVSVQFSQ